MSENKKVQCSFCGKKIDKEKIKTEEELVFLGTDPGTVICMCRYNEKHKTKSC